MAPRIFVTGATGYIGGDVLYNVYNTHPDYEYVVLIRTQEKADAVKKLFPKVETVIGNLDDSNTIKDQASKADIVIHTADASDHEGAAKAIAAGLLEGHSAEKPGYWLHTGGTGILTYTDSDADNLGEWSDKEYNDWSGVKEVTNLPDHAFHRNVDKIVLEAGTKHGDVVKTALLCPPTIYGKGRGPSNSRSRQAYELTRLILQEKYIPITGKGKARWNEVHVHDLSDLFVLLVDAAVAKKSDSELWGAEGYYFAENGEFIWSDLAKHIGEQAVQAGYISKPETKPLSKQAALDAAGFEAVSWGLNSRAKAERARKLLGWKPSRKSIMEEVPEMLKEEHARL